MKRNLLTFGILAVAMLLPCVASAKKHRRLSDRRWLGLHSLR